MDNPISAKGPDNPLSPLVPSKTSGTSIIPTRDPGRKATITASSNTKTVGVNFSVGSVLQSLRRRWFLAFSLASFLVAGGVTAAWFALQPVATARATLLVASTQPKLMFTTADNTSGVRDDSVNYQRVQATLFKSRFVFNAALKKVANLSIVKDKPDILDWLEQNVKVDTSVGTEILRVSISGDQPQELVQLLGAIVDAYMKEVVDKERYTRLERLKQIKDLNKKYEKELNDKRENWRNLANDAEVPG